MVTGGVQAQHNVGDHNLQVRLLTFKSNESKTSTESAEWRHFLSLPLCLGFEEREKYKSYCAEFIDSAYVRVEVALSMLMQL